MRCGQRAEPARLAGIFTNVSLDKSKEFEREEELQRAQDASAQERVNQLAGMMMIKEVMFKPRRCNIGLDVRLYSPRRPKHA